MSRIDGESYDVVIAGGGLAGCTAAMVLAGAGRRVLVLEKERMPRDKLCGEFLSNEVSALCSRLGVLEQLTDAGARQIRRLRATAPKGPAFETTLPSAAMGVSRRTLDAVFFNHAAERGAEMRDQCSVRDIGGSMEDGYLTTFEGGDVRSRMVLGAYGRRDKLDRRLDRAFLRDASTFVAFKAHFVGADLEDCIELHSFPGGYCGVLTEDHGALNVCWIARDQALKSSGGSPDGMMDASFRANHHLGGRLGGLRRTTEFHAAGQLIFHKKSLFDSNVCMIGDAAGMIAPVCGDGMAMAIQSGELAAQNVDRFLAGATDAAGFRKSYERAWNTRFTRRMRLGRLLHAACVRPGLAHASLQAARFVPGAARALIRATRG